MEGSGSPCAELLHNGQYGVLVGRKAGRLPGAAAVHALACSGVNPTVEAACIAAAAAGIGIAGTVTIAIAGFHSTKNATSQAIAAGIASTRATLAAAREDRFWEKQAAAYEEVIAALLYRQMKRQHELRMYRLNDAGEQQIKEFFSSYEPPGWFQAQARLRAYASDEVWEAFEATQKADIEVWGLYEQWKALAEHNRLAMESGRPGVAADGETTLNARRAVNPAVEEAEAREDVVVKLIREELRSKPESTGMALDPSRSG
jgi:hypothetical protein